MRLALLLTAFLVSGCVTWPSFGGPSWVTQELQPKRSGVIRWLAGGLAPVAKARRDEAFSQAMAWCGSDIHVTHERVWVDGSLYLHFDCYTGH